MSHVSNVVKSTVRQSSHITENEPNSLFIGMLKSPKDEKVKTKSKFTASLNSTSMISKVTILPNGTVFTEWVPAVPPIPEVQVNRLAMKTLKLGKVKAQTGSSGNFKVKDDYSMVFIPCSASSSDFKLLITKNSIDREFMQTHSPSLDPPRLKQ